MVLDDWIKEKANIESMKNREELEIYQLKMLNNLIQYVKKNSSFYRDLYKDLDEIKSMEDIDKIPIINAQDIIENANKMVCVSQSDISRISSINTSGTTGKYKRLFFTKEDQELTIDFFMQGLSFLVNKNDTMMIMMPYERENSVGDLIKKALINMQVTPVVNGTLSSFESTTNLMISNNVNSIVGMPVEVLALGRYIKNKNLNIKIKSILLSADMVNDTLINEIKNVYNCQVYNHFGMTETGLGGAVDCDFHQGMHIRENDLLIEIINPVTKEILEDGESGEILITTLTRKAMPLIRYATGDISSFVTGNCGCKSIIKRLDKIKYRLNDRLSLGKNIYININMIDNILFKMENLVNYKISADNYEDYCELKLKLAFFQPNEEEINPEYTEELKNIIKNLLLSNIRIKKVYEMGALNFNINIIYTEEYVNFYKGKRNMLG